MAVAFSEVAPTLKVSAYLVREGFEDVVDVLTPSSRPGGREPMHEVQSSAVSNLPQGTRAFLAMNRARVPDWASALAPYFPELREIHNTSSRLVLFLPVDQRVFALCFGYGHASLNVSAVESNFGLKYAARTLDPEVIFGLDSRRMSATARSQAVQTIAGERLQDLDIPLAGEFVRKLAGKLDDGAAAEIEGVSTIVASDGVAFKTDFVLSEIQKVLTTMLQVVEDKDVKDQFEFVDALEALKTNDDRVKQLEDILCDELNRVLQGTLPVEEPLLGLAPPESPAFDLLETVVCRIDGDVFPLLEVSINGLIEVFRTADKRFSKSALQSVRMIVVDDSGEERAASSLRSWLVFEHEQDGARFILTMGRWFNLNEAFANRLNADLGVVPRDVA